MRKKSAATTSATMAAPTAIPATAPDESPFELCSAGEDVWGGLVDDGGFVTTSVVVVTVAECANAESDASTASDGNCCPGKSM